MNCANEVYFWLLSSTREWKEKEFCVRSSCHSRWELCKNCFNNAHRHFHVSHTIAAKKKRRRKKHTKICNNMSSYQFAHEIFSQNCYHTKKLFLKVKKLFLSFFLGQYDATSRTSECVLFLKKQYFLIQKRVRGEANYCRWCDKRTNSFVTYFLFCYSAPQNRYENLRDVVSRKWRCEKNFILQSFSMRWRGILNIWKIRFKEKKKLKWWEQGLDTRNFYHFQWQTVVNIESVLVWIIKS